LAQDWIATNCSKFTDKGEWPPISPDINPLNYHVWGLQDISSQDKEHWYTAESLTVNMGPDAAGLNQQGYTELHKEVSSLRES